MEKSTPVRKPHTSTADLLTWTEGAQSASAASSAQRSSGRYNQPSDGISKVLFGGQVTDDEAQSLLNKKPCSGYKMKEMTGSGIFAANAETTANGSTNKTGVRTNQRAMNSQISFSADASVSPKKPTSLPEVAKQRELSGSLQSETDAKNKKISNAKYKEISGSLHSESDAKNKKISNAKYKEISGHDIFAPPETKPRSLAAAATESRERKDMIEPAPRNVRTSVKVSNPAGGQTSILFTDEPVVMATKKIHNQKFQELTGNDIFKGDAPPGSAEKPLSQAKLQEMSGNDIFSDGKAESRDYYGGVRKPPGGESSIALV
ncbi:hypothetical protein like AT4G39860 [Hibiscus trionum]|uniref:DUF4057 domain-containing protein n=1 Tax=Hibiscus trionum TaxID=183268 RepID=A0A9W7GX69_HIBTR|nr:hypothetical protein like AT4G39860 [Hibiscus trionum]